MLDGAAMRLWTGICAVALVMSTSPVGPPARAALMAPGRPVVTSSVTHVAAQKCKYKTDETGNCLSPAFYQCQRDWKKCNDACKSNAACLDKCEIKYAAQCGD